MSKKEVTKCQHRYGQLFGKKGDVIHRGVEGGTIIFFFCIKCLEIREVFLESG